MFYLLISFPSKKKHKTEKLKILWQSVAHWTFCESFSDRLLIKEEKFVLVCLLRAVLKPQLVANLFAHLTSFFTRIVTTMNTYFIALD